MDQNRSNKPGEERPGTSGWSPSSQPGKPAGPSSSTGTSDSRLDSGRGISGGALGIDQERSPGRTAEHIGGDGGGLDKTKEDIRRGARDLREQAVSQGREALDRVQERVGETVEQGKEQVADQIDSIGEALCSAADRMEDEQAAVGRYARMAGEQVCGLADYLREADPAEMARGVQRFARNRPEIFLGGALFTGLLIGRFLRSHEPQPDFDRGTYGRDDIARDGFRREGLGSTTGIGNAAMGGTGYGTKPGIESGSSQGSLGGSSLDSSSLGNPSLGKKGTTGSGSGSSGFGGGSSGGFGSSGSSGTSGFGTGGSGGSGTGSGSGGSQSNINKSSSPKPKRDDTSPGGPGCAI